MARNREMCAYFSINTRTFTTYNEKLNFKEPKAPMCHQYLYGIIQFMLLRL